jgi:hypothetical protein
MYHSHIDNGLTAEDYDDSDSDKEVGDKEDARNEISKKEDHYESSEELKAENYNSSNNKLEALLDTFALKSKTPISNQVFMYFDFSPH